MIIIHFFGSFFFVFSILLFSFCIARRYKKHKNIRKRILISSLYIIPIIGLVLLDKYLSSNILNYTNPGYSILSLLHFLLLFSICVLVLFTILDEHPWQIVLCAFTAYACQHTESKIESIIRSIFNLNILYTTGKFNDILLTFFLQLTIFAAVFTVIYFLFLRRCAKNFAPGAFSVNVLLTSILTIVVVLILNCIVACFADESTPLFQLSCIFSIICSIFVMILYSGIIQNNQLKWENATINQLWEKDRLQYELTKDNIEMINAKCHDLKKKIDLYQENQQFLSKEDIEELKNEISIYDSTYRTGNKALDTVLTSYSFYSEKRGITFTCIADGTLLNFMKNGDIYSLMANIISNAIEAVQKLENNKKIISLNIKKVNGLVVIREENYFDGNISYVDGNFKTTKKDSNSHGIGTKSMKIIVEKYNGTLSFKTTKDSFLVVASFPLN